MTIWMLWLLIGVVCIGLELVIPGLVIIFFGFGALITSLLSLIPFVGAYWWVQILLFVITSTLSLLFLRKYFSNIFKGTVFNQDPSAATGPHYAEVLEPISPHKEGRIKFSGTTWSAKSNTENFPIGSTVRVVKREGISYLVEKLETNT